MLRAVDGRKKERAGKPPVEGVHQDMRHGVPPSSPSALAENLFHGFGHYHSKLQPSSNLYLSRLGRGC